MTDLPTAKPRRAGWRHAATAAFWLACTSAMAQEADPAGRAEARSPAASSSSRTEREVQRQRLAREQAQADAQFQAEQDRCRQRFAETDCLRDAQRRYNRARADIRRKEVLLNDEQRKERVDAKRADLAGREQQRERAVPPAAPLPVPP